MVKQQLEAKMSRHQALERPRRRAAPCRRVLPSLALRVVRFRHRRVGYRQQVHQVDPFHRPLDPLADVLPPAARVHRVAPVLVLGSSALWVVGRVDLVPVALVVPVAPAEPVVDLLVALQVGVAVVLPDVVGNAHRSVAPSAVVAPHRRTRANAAHFVHAIDRSGARR